MCPVGRFVHKSTYYAHAKRRQEAGLIDPPAPFTPVVPALTRLLAAAQPGGTSSSSSQIGQSVIHSKRAFSTLAEQVDEGSMSAPAEKRLRVERDDPMSGNILVRIVFARFTGIILMMLQMGNGNCNN